jgi:hypothetical protein
MSTPILIGADPAEILQSPEFLWTAGALLGTLLFGAFLLNRAERWRKRQMSNSPEADIQQLSSYRAMYERGELTKEEYDRIRLKEAHRLRNKVAPKTEAPVTERMEPPAQPSPPEPGSPPAQP